MPGMILDCFCMILKMLLSCPGPSPPYGGVYFFWRFHLASHGYSCSPGFPVKLPKGFTGSCYGVSWVSSLASGGTSPHGPYICPCYLVFQRLPSLSLNTCQALHIYVFAYFILISQATAAPLPDPRKFYSSSTHFLDVIFLELTPLLVGCNYLLSVYALALELFIPIIV